MLHKMMEIDPGYYEKHQNKDFFWFFFGGGIGVGWAWTELLAFVPYIQEFHLKNEYNHFFKISTSEENILKNFIFVLTMNVAY